MLALYLLTVMSALFVNGNEPEETCVSGIQKEHQFLVSCQQFLSNDTALSSLLDLAYKGNNGTIEIDPIIEAIEKTSSKEQLRLLKAVRTLLNNKSWQKGTTSPVHRMQLAKTLRMISEKKDVSIKDQKEALALAQEQEIKTFLEIKVELDINTHQSMKKVTDLIPQAYYKIDTKYILSIIRNSNMEHEQKMNAFINLFRLMKQNSKHRSLHGLVLAHELSNLQNNEEYNKVSANTKTALTAVKEDLPTSIRNIAFSPTVKIHLQGKWNPYMTGGPANNTYDKYRREVTATLNPNSRHAEWALERYDLDSGWYYIKNVLYGEYLMASVLDYDQDRRRLFTWTNKNKLDSSLFSIVPVGENVNIVSVRDQEYVVVDKRLNKNPEDFVVSTRKKMYKYETNRAKSLESKLQDKWRIEPY